jgi:hypothetical protein
MHKNPLKTDCFVPRNDKLNGSAFCHCEPPFSGGVAISCRMHKNLLKSDYFVASQ